ncbi:hypothetical protein CsSME_00022793 [Camellia sinensis var. sinensis]
MEVLAVVQGHVADRAGAELLAAKSELEAKRCKVVSLEFQLASERRTLELAQKYCSTANERWEEAMANCEVLRDQAVKEKKETDGWIAELERAREEKRVNSASEKAELEKALAEERAKSASERAAYPDLYMVAVKQFKGSADFQMAIDATVGSSLVKEGEGGLGRWGRPLEEGVKRR